jgi:hypothetical protein
MRLQDLLKKQKDVGINWENLTVMCQGSITKALDSCFVV